MRHFTCDFAVRAISGLAYHWWAALVSLRLGREQIMPAVEGRITCSPRIYRPPQPPRLPLGVTIKAVGDTSVPRSPLLLAIFDTDGAILCLRLLAAVIEELTTATMSQGIARVVRMIVRAIYAFCLPAESRCSTSGTWV